MQWEVLSCSVMCTKGEEELEEEEEEVQEGVEGEQDSPVSLQPSGSHTKPIPGGGGGAGQSCLSSAFRKPYQTNLIVEGEQDSPVSLQPSRSHTKHYGEGEQDSPVSLQPSGSHTKPCLWGGGGAGQSCLFSSFRYPYQTILTVWGEGEHYSPVSLQPSGSHTKPKLWGGESSLCQRVPTPPPRPVHEVTTGKNHLNEESTPSSPLG